MNFNVQAVATETTDPYAKIFNKIEQNIESPIVYLPASKDPRVILHTMKGTLMKITTLDVRRLTELDSGGSGIEANTSLNSHVPIFHAVPFMYGEPIYGARPFGTKGEYGDFGYVKLHWVDKQTRFRGGWISDAYIEIACHATKESSSEHWAMTASLQLDDNGGIIDLLPRVSSADDGDNYGIQTNARCICSTLRQAARIH